MAPMYVCNVVTLFIFKIYLILIRIFFLYFQEGTKIEIVRGECATGKHVAQCQWISTVRPSRSQDTRTSHNVSIIDLNFESISDRKKCRSVFQ